MGIEKHHPDPAAAAAAAVLAGLMEQLTRALLHVPEPDPGPRAPASGPVPAADVPRPVVGHRRAGPVLGDLAFLDD